VIDDKTGDDDSGEVGRSWKNDKSQKKQIKTWLQWRGVISAALGMS